MAGKIEKPVHWTPVFNEKKFIKDIVGFDKWIMDNYNKYHKKST